MLAYAWESLVGRDILFFIDNESAVGSLIRSSSTELDAALATQVAHAILVQLQARTWWDWVDTKSNPADGLSRLGMQDPRAKGPHADWDCSELKEYPIWAVDADPWEAARRLLRHFGCPF